MTYKDLYPRLAPIYQRELKALARFLSGRVRKSQLPRSTAEGILLHVAIRHTRKCAP